ncbi:single-stranded DNA-binding protein [Candidatus Dojkabacteria bacterium]|jgi:hypothetical protein|nr:single-stranded DNA-binding protein [Candidatus Dojkabacteria bacterium]
MGSFANLKRGSEFDKLKKKIEETMSPSNAGDKDDERFWNPVTDKAGNGMATIRFLPGAAVDGDDAIPWVRYWKHAFQAKGGWLIDNCLTTLEGECPVCEHNRVLWNSGVEANKKTASNQKRKLIYVANIMVISDPSNPENDGKVFLYKFGKKIFDKINEAMNPAFADESQLNPFDLWVGANFKLKMRQVEGYRNYDKSEFEKPSALSDDDGKLEAIWKSEYSLNEFVDPSKFNSYEKIKARLDLVLGLSGTPKGPSPEKVDDSMSKMNESSSNSGDEDMDYFNNLANESDDVPF